MPQLWLDNRAALQGLVSVYNHSYVVFSSLAAKYFGQTLSNAKLNVVSSRLLSQGALIYQVMSLAGDRLRLLQ